jgi:hypothetical protein
MQRGDHVGGRSNFPLGDIEIDLPEALSALAQAARVRGAGVALLLDELQYLSDREFSALIMAMQRVAKTNAP